MNPTAAATATAIDEIATIPQVRKTATKTVHQVSGDEAGQISPVVTVKRCVPSASQTKELMHAAISKLNASRKGRLLSVFGIFATLDIIADIGRPRKSAINSHRLSGCSQYVCDSLMSTQPTQASKNRETQAEHLVCHNMMGGLR